MDLIDITMWVKSGQIRTHMHTKIHTQTNRTQKNVGGKKRAGVEKKARKNKLKTKQEEKERERGKKKGEKYENEKKGKERGRGMGAGG